MSSRASSGKKNQPPSHKKPTSGSMKHHFNRGEAGKKRKPITKPSGKKKDVRNNSAEFTDLSH